jgi:hypothetical protein
MSITKPILSSISVAAIAIATPALAQHTEGDAASPVTQWGRMMAEPGTFWLDGNDDTEVVRYTSPRDVRLCLPEPSGVYAAQKGYSLRITWDATNTAILRPGNCLYFDAKQVKVKPATTLPAGVTLRGRVDASSALVHN